jgi:zinc transport system substrate-binding protein
MPHCTWVRAPAGRPARLLAAAVAAAALGLALPAALAAAPRVVVSVKPLHSLVAGVMAGVGEPELLVRGAGSPHTYSLKPSDARLLDGAQVIFWVGESLEGFLARPLAALGSRARIVAVAKAPGIALLRGRAGGAWEDHEDHEDHEGHGDEAPAAGGGDAHGDAGYDGHVWLDPANARAVVRLAATVLGEADPANRARYAGNADRLVARVDALDAELQAALAPVRDVPFIVFHDAYHYLERRYGLRAVGAVAVSPERGPGARRVAEVRERIRASGARCVFSEPQFPSALLGTLTEGTAVRVATLDPLGADLPAGPEAWFALMRNLAAALDSCLGPGAPGR